jgi:SagB-type dehydrogenase family enzyme
MKPGRRTVPATLYAQLIDRVTLVTDPEGSIVASLQDYSVVLGKFSAGTGKRARDLRRGLPLSALTSAPGSMRDEMRLLLRRLAGHGLLEYRLGRSGGGGDEIVIEPQVPDYWPGTARLVDADVLVLSRFAYMRRRGTDFVLESPRAGALFKICNPQIAAGLATLSAPQKIGQLRRRPGFPGLDLLALLLDCQMLFKVDPTRANALREAEGDEQLVLWDFHDLLFHTRSTAGRHANPLGGLCPYGDIIAPLPAVRPRWPGRKINLRKVVTPEAQSTAFMAKLLRARHSTRSFEGHRPILLGELAGFLDGAARVHSRATMQLDLGGVGPLVAYAARPYPSAGAAYELELYLAVDKCEGLARGFYHYDAGAHALLAIEVQSNDLEAMLQGAEFAMGASGLPQVVITIAARFGRVAWKYSSLAYALILKDVGVLMQTLYLMAGEAGLGGCAIGSADIALFAKMTGMEFHVEGPVGQFALGRAANL